MNRVGSLHHGHDEKGFSSTALPLHSPSPRPGKELSTLHNPPCVAQHLSSTRLSSFDPLTSILIVIVVVVMAASPWLDQPVMLHSSRKDKCKLNPSQCQYRHGHWRYWYGCLSLFARLDIDRPLPGKA